MVKFRMKAEVLVASDSNSWCVSFNVNFFNSTNPYLDIYDQFKVLSYTVIYRRKETDTLTNENTAVPVLYHSYDVDAQGRTVDITNMMRLTNYHKTLLTPFKSKALTVRPIWDMAPTKFGDVTSYVRKVDGQLCILEHCLNRIVVKHIICFRRMF